MSIDVFSIWSIRNIGAIVSVWQKELQVGLSLSEEPDEVQALSPRGKLVFLGYVVQQHKERTGYDKKISEDTGEQVKIRRRVLAYEKIGAMFPQKVVESLGEMFASKKMVAHLGDIRHLGSLAPMSQSQHVPMISVAGTGSYTILRKHARGLYRDIALRYLENLNAS